MTLKSVLKTLKLNESNISMILGALVVIIAGIFIFNYFKTKPGKLTTPVSTEAPTAPTVGKRYTVAAGDNLWKISEEAYGSGYNWVDIVKENKLANANHLDVGQTLTIPDVKPKKLTSAGQLGPTSSDAISGATYTVVKGDNLWKIAVRAYGDGYKWVEISRENKLVNPNLIHPGNVLTLPR